MENTKLLKIQAALPNFFSYFKADNVLSLSEDKSSPPFAYLIYDKSIAKQVLLSISVDYPTSINIAEVIIKASKITPIALSEPFYISTNDGKTYFNDAAYDQWSLDSIDMKALIPISPSIN